MKNRARKGGAAVPLVFSGLISSVTHIVKNKKPKKCQPAASNMTDLIQTVHVADSGLARPKKLTERKNIKKEKNHKMKNKDRKTLRCTRARKKGAKATSSSLSPGMSVICMVKMERLKKCQPAASNMTDLIQTAHVADSGLARSKKLTERKKTKKGKKIRKMVAIAGAKKGGATEPSVQLIPVNWSRKGLESSVNLINSANGLIMLIPHSIRKWYIIRKSKIKSSPKRLVSKTVDNKNTAVIKLTPSNHDFSTKLPVIKCNSLLTQSTSLPVHQSTSPPVLRYTNPPIQSTCHPIRQSIRQGFKLKSVNWSVSRKLRNKGNKIYNGNIRNKETLKLVHWNLGSRRWENKIVDIQHWINEYNPDVAFVSEANLYFEVPDYMNAVPGYEITTTKDFEKCGISRLVLLTKTGYDVTILKEMMQNNIASIWIRIPRNGRKLYVGGIYREHKTIGTRNQEQIGDKDHQEQRWRIFTEQWTRKLTPS